MATNAVQDSAVYSGEMNVEDLIAEENVVVTVTPPVSSKHQEETRDEYRAQHRGRASRRAPSCAARGRPCLDHFFLTSTHNGSAVLHQQGPHVYRLKVSELPRGSRRFRRDSTWRTCYTVRPV